MSTPLRAAAIFPPLSSRSVAPTTTSSQRVDRKTRFASGAIIGASVTLASFEVYNVLVLFSFVKSSSSGLAKPLKAQAAFARWRRIPQAEPFIPVPAARSVIRLR
jgi:hypothetical protein